MTQIELSGLVCVWVVATALWIIARMLKPVTSHDDWSLGVLRFTALVMFAVGVLGVCVASVGRFAVLAWPITMGVWWRAAAHFRAIQRRNLLAAISLAVERQMPIAPVVRAFASELDGSFADRVRRFATRLESASSLDDAIAADPRMLPKEARLAAHLGQRANDLAGALRAISTSSIMDRTMVRPVMLRLLNVLLLLIVVPFFLTFMKFKIEPMMVKMLSDFDYYKHDGMKDLVSRGAILGRDLPQDTTRQASMAAHQFVFSTNGTYALLMIGSIACAVLVIVFFLGWRQWKGATLVRVPFWTKIVNWADAAGLLRILALGVRRETPLVSLLVGVAEDHPKRSVRSRVARVVRNLNDGQTWEASLQRQQVLRSSDVAVLAAAQRHGTLAEALDTMAESFERRATYRLQVLAQFLLPLMLLPLGLVVAAIVIGYFVPLTMFINSMS